MTLLFGHNSDKTGKREKSNGKYDGKESQKDEKIEQDDSCKQNKIMIKNRRENIESRKKKV